MTFAHAQVGFSSSERRRSKWSQTKRAASEANKQEKKKPNRCPRTMEQNVPASSARVAAGGTKVAKQPCSSPPAPAPAPHLLSATSHLGCGRQRKTGSAGITPGGWEGKGREKCTGDEVEATLAQARRAGFFCLTLASSPFFPGTKRQRERNPSEEQRQREPRGQRHSGERRAVIYCC